MINLKDPEDQASGFVSAAAVLTMVGTLGYLLFTMWRPGTTTADIDAAAKKQQDKLRFDTRLADKKLGESTEAINAVTWSDLPENIGTKAFHQVAALAQSRKIKLNAFRPQREDVADDLNTLPYLVTVEGPFTSVLAFERDLDSPKNRLAISLIQMSSADPNTDRVTANIGVVAYLQPTAPAVLTPSPPAVLSTSPKEKTAHA